MTTKCTDRQKYLTSRKVARSHSVKYIFKIPCALDPNAVRKIVAMTYRSVRHRLRLCHGRSCNYFAGCQFDSGNQFNTPTTVLQKVAAGIRDLFPRPISCEHIMVQMEQYPSLQKTENDYEKKTTY